jgi:hypothetical protein
MEIKDLKEELGKKEELLKRTETIYIQLQGQIALLRDLIKKDEISVKKEEVPVVPEQPIKKEGDN